jgi:hypothetical protein
LQDMQSLCIHVTSWLTILPILRNVCILTTMSDLTPEELDFENSELNDSTFPDREEAVREFIDQVPSCHLPTFQTNSKSLVTRARSINVARLR